MSGRGGMRRNYSPYENERLIRMVEQEGLSFEVIAERLGRAPEGLRNQYGRLTGRIPSRAQRAKKAASDRNPEAANPDRGA